MTHERVARESNVLGPTIATAQIIQLLEHANPELVDMLNKGARDIGDTARIRAGFCMFYQLLLVEASTADTGAGLHPLPRVAAETRTQLVRKIDQCGVEGFVIEAIARA